MHAICIKEALTIINHYKIPLNLHLEKGDFNDFPFLKEGPGECINNFLKRYYASFQRICKFIHIKTKHKFYVHELKTTTHTEHNKFKTRRHRDTEIFYYIFNY